ncbi:hypothetical protein [Methanosarcina horonobensis]|uniref:hypothetical protein n=1 Tax=Methanosarcina horonobensis TaxID=418008 RepID=UPI00138E08B9|nr:hypothetical protein [Methanosarcina horonobensis]
MITERLTVSLPPIPPVSSIAVNNRTTDARPPGPNQPRKNTVSVFNFMPIREIATGIIQISVRLSTAFASVIPFKRKAATIAPKAIVSDVPRNKKPAWKFLFTQQCLKFNF